MADTKVDWKLVRVDKWRGLDKDAKKAAIECEIERALDLCAEHGGELSLDEKCFIRDALANCADGLFDLAASAVDDLVTKAGMSPEAKLKPSMMELSDVDLEEVRRWLDLVRAAHTQQNPIFWRPRNG